MMSNVIETVSYHSGVCDSSRKYGVVDEDVVWHQSHVDLGTSLPVFSARESILARAHPW